MPRGLRPCRSGGASSAALATRLRVRPSRPDRRAEPRCPLRFAQGQRFHPPLWPLGTRTLRRHRPPPAGRSWPPPPRQAKLLLVALRLWSGHSACSRTSDLGERGCRQSAGAAGGHWLLRPRVPDGRAALGCRGRERSCGPRGAPARIALSGRGRRSVRARARGRPGPHPATRGTGKQEASRSEEDRTGHPRDRQARGSRSGEGARATGHCPEGKTEGKVRRGREGGRRSVRGADRRRPRRRAPCSSAR